MRLFLTEQQILLLIENLQLDDIYNKYYKAIPREIFNNILSIDPTSSENKMGNYTKWLLKLYMAKKLKEEDFYKAKEYLTCFNTYKNRITEKDINKFKSINDLYVAIEPFYQSNEANSKSEEIRRIKQGAEKVYEDDNWLIIVPHTKEASCYYGKGTQWCTAADKSYNAFDSYNDEGNLYININKRNPKEKYQFHFETDSFMDATDSPINSPVCENIPISSGALEWYEENIDDAYKLTSMRYNFYIGDNKFTLEKGIEEKSWTLFDDRGSIIAVNLLVNDCETFFNTLYSYNFVAVNNIHDKTTVLSLSGDEIIYISDEVSYYDYETLNIIGNESQMIILKIRDTIYLSDNTNYDYYTNSDRKVKFIRLLDSMEWNYIYYVYKRDDTFDLVNVFKDKVICNLSWDLAELAYTNDNELLAYSNEKKSYVKINFDNDDMKMTEITEEEVEQYI